MSVRTQLELNLKSVEDRIGAACARANRMRADVTLVAVTKSVGAEVAGMLFDLGVRDFGESRPQSLWAKAATLPPTVRWHQIGHLQRNKLERTLPLVALTHSVDNLRLLDSIDKWSEKQQRRSDVLLEFNMSREEEKTGFALTELPAIIERLTTLRSTCVRGLMTMAALADDPEQSRPAFAELRVLRDRLRTVVPDPHSFQHLSMGMTQDFEIAIAEGATLVRIGSALFEGVP